MSKIMSWAEVFVKLGWSEPSIEVVLDLGRDKGTTNSRVIMLPSPSYIENAFFGSKKSYSIKVDEIKNIEAPWGACRLSLIITMNDGSINDLGYDNETDRTADLRKLYSLIEGDKNGHYNTRSRSR